MLNAKTQRRKAAKNCFPKNPLRLRAFASLRYFLPPCNKWSVIQRIEMFNAKAQRRKELFPQKPFASSRLCVFALFPSTV